MAQSVIAQEFVHRARRVTVNSDRSRQLLNTFWISVVLLVLFTIFGIQPTSTVGLISAAMIAAAALLPVYLWCAGYVPGMPIFPIFSVTYLWTYAWSFLWDHPGVVSFSSEHKLIASATVTGFLLIGTLVWYKAVTLPKKPVRSYRVLSGRRSNTIFLLSLLSSVIVTMAIRGNWFALILSIVSILRSASFGLSAISVFALGYRWGKGELPRKVINQFLILFVLYLAATTISLLIIGAISVFTLTAIGFVLGRKKVPWTAVIIAGITITILHHGKGIMRAKYMYDRSGMESSIQPWEYMPLFAEWGYYGIADLAGAPNREYVDYEEAIPLKERVALSPLLLLTQNEAGMNVSFMNGETYVIIPAMLIPRILAPDKLTAHEGNNLINIHYGMQSREETEITTIGWGLLNESYANFGYFGCAALAIVLGLFYGLVTRWIVGTPLLAARSLFGMLVISFAFQAEFSASVYITALFQSTMPLVAISFLFMTVQRTEHSVAMTAL